MSPKESIQYVVTSSLFGAVLVARSQQGICAVLIDESTPTLLEDLQRRFPKASLLQGDEALQNDAPHIARYIETSGPKPTFPLDLRGTAFQKEVWAHLRTIPTGSTATYTDIAEALGRPKSVRAIAGACAANPIAVLIPCHRVIKRDGSLSGYRWGVERKRKLLEMEASASSAEEKRVH